MALARTYRISKIEYQNMFVVIIITIPYHRRRRRWVSAAATHARVSIYQNTSAALIKWLDRRITQYYYRVGLYTTEDLICYGTRYYIHIIIRYWRAVYGYLAHVLYLYTSYYNRKGEENKRKRKRKNDESQIGLQERDVYLIWTFFSPSRGCIYI